MTVFGDGKQTRAFSHIDDVAPTIARAPQVKEAYQQVFNVGADKPYTVLELAQEVADAFGVEPNVTHLPARNEVVHAFASHEKVNTVFRPPDPIPLKDGVRRMAEWVKQRGAMQPVTFDNIEVPKNIPPSWLEPS
jgi:UDP-glucose 4-epimerase